MLFTGIRDGILLAARCWEWIELDEDLMKTCIAGLALIMLSFTVLAQTQEPTTGKGQLKGACSADVQKFCADTPRGKGQVRACLETHQADLSDACKAAMAARSKQWAKLATGGSVIVPLLVLRALIRLLASQPPRLEVWMLAGLGILAMIIASALLFFFE
jgi:Cysteine rich repeat